MREESIKAWTAKAVANSLAVSDEQITRWVKTGVLQVRERIGSAIILSKNGVDRLSAAKSKKISDLNGQPNAVVVRPNEDSWHESMIDDQMDECAGSGWRCKKPESRIGHALVAMMGTLVVGVWNITGVEIRSDGRTNFSLESAKPEQVRAYRDRWIEFSGQAPVRYLPAERK